MSAFDIAPAILREKADFASRIRQLIDKQSLDSARAEFL